MVYRIRYVEGQAGRNGQATETVEANSPAEAIVKFQATRYQDALASRRQIITSVSLEETGFISRW